LARIGHRVLYSGTSSGHLASYNVDKDKKFYATLFDFKNLKNQGEREINYVPSKGEAILDYIMGSLLPYSIFFPAGVVISGGDKDWIIAGLALSAVVALKFSTYYGLKALRNALDSIPAWQEYQKFMAESDNKYLRLKSRSIFARMEVKYTS